VGSGGWVGSLICVGAGVLAGGCVGSAGVAEAGALVPVGDGYHAPVVAVADGGTGV
jgi:hypothetical protein